MPDSEGALHLQIRKAAEKVQGTKFCFQCQRHRPIEQGKYPTGRSWRCFDCLGRSKEAFNGRK